MANLDTILEKYINPTPGAHGSLLGAAFIVKDKHGVTLYSKASGKLNFEGDSPLFTSDAVGWIASMSKLVTAVSAMQLLERGLIKLDDDVGKIVPQLSNMDIITGFEESGSPVMVKQTKPITLRHLLTHSSGLGHDMLDPRLSKWSSATGKTLQNGSYSLEGYTIPLIFEPGEGWAYGVGLDWVGHLVSILTDSTFEAYLAKHVFEPLEMSSTTFRLAERPDLIQRRAAIALRAEPSGPLSAGGAALVPEEPPMASGGSGLFSTANDYAKLLGALVKGGDGILTPESVRELCQPQLSDSKFLMETLDSPLRDFFCPEYPSGTPVNYALGGAVNLEDIPGKRRKGSMMWSGLSNPHWWIDLESGIAATLFTQVLPPGDPVVKELYDELERAVYKTLVQSADASQMNLT